MVFGIIIYVCWGGFGLVWLAGWLYNAAKSPAAVKRGPATYLGTLLFLALITAGYLLGSTQLFAEIRMHSRLLAIIGSAVLVAGTLFTLWARLTLGTMWSSSPIAREHHSLKTTGPYAITRHPIYTGLLFMLAGTALINGFGGWLIYLAVGVIFFEVKIHAEEKLLTETLGDSYRRYRERIPQLIPGLNLLHREQHAR